MNRHSLYIVAPGISEIREESLPALDEGEVLVRAVLSGISAGTELLIYRGQAPDDLAVDSSLPALRGRFGFPIKYGYSVVGHVVECGANVDRALEGRLVFAFNPHESHFVTRSSDLIPLPSDCTVEDAIFLPNMETAISLVMDGSPALGEQIAVVGQGIVGLLVAYLLSAMSPASLVTLDNYKLRRDMAVRLGAHASFDPGDPDTLKHVREALQGERSYSGADLVYELSGVPAALDLAIALAGYNGRVVIGSWYGNKLATLNLGGRFHRDRITLVSSQVSTLAPAITGRWSQRRRIDLAWAMLRWARPANLITHTISFENAPTAYQLLDKSPHDALQVVLAYDEL